jgi:hypothetical protein
MALSSVYLASGGAQLEVRKQRAQEDQANRQLDIQQQTANDNSRQNYMQELQGKQTLEANEFALKMKREEEARRKKQAALADIVFKSTEGQRLSAEGDDDLNLASKFMQMAKSLAGTDPQASNDYFKQAQEFKNKALKSAEDSLKLRGDKLRAIGDVSAGVMDSKTANEAAVELAKLGKQVPPEVLDWANPAAKGWWARQAQFSEAAVKANQLELDKKKFESVDDKRDADVEIAKRNANTKEQALQLARDKIAKAKTKVVNPNKEQLASTVAYMAEIYPTFADAEPSVQKRAANDVEALTLQYMSESQMSQQQARQAAEKQVASLISEDGTYSVPETTAKPAAGQYVEGKVYTDKNGRKAKYVGGKWVPQ